MEAPAGGSTSAIEDQLKQAFEGDVDAPVEGEASTTPELNSADHTHVPASEVPAGTVGAIDNGDGTFDMTSAAVRTTVDITPPPIVTENATSSSPEAESQTVQPDMEQQLLESFYGGAENIPAPEKASESRWTKVKKGFLKGVESVANFGTRVMADINAGVADQRAAMETVNQLAAEKAAQKKEVRTAWLERQKAGAINGLAAAGKWGSEKMSAAGAALEKGVVTADTKLQAVQDSIAKGAGDMVYGARIEKYQTTVDSTNDNGRLDELLAQEVANYSRALDSKDNKEINKAYRFLSIAHSNRDQALKIRNQAQAQLDKNKARQAQLQARFGLSQQAA